MRNKTYAPGETIVAEGTHGDETYLITDGTVLICKETDGRTRIPMATLSEGEVFGEMYLFDDTGFRTASVIAQTEVSVAIIPRDEMEQYLANTPAIMHSIMKTLSTRLAQTSQENSRMKFQGAGNPLKRIARLFGF